MIGIETGFGFTFMWFGGAGRAWRVWGADIAVRSDVRSHTTNEVQVDDLKKGPLPL